MVFSSSIFLFLFLPIALIGYYLLDRRFKNTFLLLISLFFYAWGEPRFVFIMMGSILVNHILALLIDRQLCYAEELSSDKREQAHMAQVYRKRAKGWLVLMVVFNLSLFFVFKYLNFTLENANLVLACLGKAPVPQTAIHLPIGISFFTFQAMSYVFDVYYRRGEVQKNPLNTALYVSFFPQLIAGPIVRYQTVANEIRSRQETLDDFVKGIGRFIIGLAKKAVLSNTIAVVVDAAYAALGEGSLTVGYAWLGAIGYSLQIYFDFSGYSDMAIGLGLMFGFHFLENFNYPYISKSISEFWSRWHISLGSWFKDYVYLPIYLKISHLKNAENKKKYTILQADILSLCIVWALTGIWHGANWTFIIWGLYQLAFIIYDRMKASREKANKKRQRESGREETQPKQKGWPHSVFHHITTILIVIVGQVIFRADTMGSALNYISALFGFAPNGGWSYLTGNMISEYAVVFIVAALCCMDWSKLFSKSLKRMDQAAPTVVFTVKALILVVLAAVGVSFCVASTYNPFIYFNF